MELANGATPNTTPYGALPLLFTDGNSSHAGVSTLRDALLLLGALPAGTVRCAVLRLYCTEERSPTNRPGRLDVRAVLQRWTETEATWSNRTAGVAWSGGRFEPGAGLNYSTNVYATKAATDSENWSGTWVELDITPLVNEWVSGARSNFGLAVMSYSGTGGDKRFSFTARESTNHAEIQIILAAPDGRRPTITGLHSPGRPGCGMTWDAVPGSVYRLEYSTNLLATNWVSVGARTSDATRVTMSDPTATNASRRFYRVVEP